MKYLVSSQSNFLFYPIDNNENAYKVLYIYIYIITLCSKCSGKKKKVVNIIPW